MTEIWKDVIGYKGLYQVSNLGRVKSLPRSFVKSDGRTQPVYGTILKQTKGRKGYMHVCLSVEGECVNRTVHQLVATAFLPNPYHHTQVNHRDENQTNNRVDNLEWCSAEYNLNYGCRNKKASISNSSPVEQYTLDGKYIRSFYGTREAGRQIGRGATASANIAACCRGERNNAYGFLWRYVK